MKSKNEGGQRFSQAAYFVLLNDAKILRYNPRRHSSRVIAAPAGCAAISIEALRSLHVVRDDKL
jgi:hypothetical protein